MRDTTNGKALEKSADRFINHQAEKPTRQKNAGERLLIIYSFFLAFTVFMVTGLTEAQRRDNRRPTSILRGPVKVDGNLEVTGHLDANVDATPQFRVITAAATTGTQTNAAVCERGYTLEFWALDAHNVGFNEKATHNYCQCLGDQTNDRITATFHLSGKPNDNLICRCRGLCMKN